MPSQPHGIAKRSIAERTVAELDGTVLDRVHDKELRQAAETPLRQLTVVQYRMLIRSGLGLSYVVPKALEHLRAHPLTQASYMPGDLLACIVRLPDDWWRAHTSLLPDVCAAIERALPRIGKKQGAIDTLVGELEQRLRDFKTIAVAG